ncbi:hypothetical protein D3C81_928490 [compost metagenome]
MAYFVQHQPSGFVGDPDLLVQPHCGDTIRKQKQLYRLEPLQQGQMRSLKKGPNQRRRLMPTDVTFK